MLVEKISALMGKSCSSLIRSFMFLSFIAFLWIFDTFAHVFQLLCELDMFGDVQDCPGLAL